MPLELLGPLVVAGIAVVVMLVSLTVNHAPRLLENPETARNRFLFDYPKAQFRGDWLITDDRQNAICEMNAGENGSTSSALALVEVMGSKHLTRTLTETDIASVKKESDHLILELDDFTLPAISLKFDDRERFDTARKLCQSIVSGNAASTLDEGKTI